MCKPVYIKERGMCNIISSSKKLT